MIKKHLINWLFFVIIEEMIKNLDEKLKSLPTCPGVYIMKDSEGEVIYVGKAVVLKNRVRQYFHSPKNLTDKVIAMVSKISDFSYHITKTESDALILEANLIKKYKPQYNILLKDDKNYPYIKIDLKDKFPKIETTRRLKSDGKKYFGPYMGYVSIGALSNLISDAFELRTCSLNFDRIPKSHRPCLNFHSGKCKAPCVGKISKEEYRQSIDKVVSFLKGDVDFVKGVLTEKMQAFAEEELFERAMDMREMLKLTQKIKEKKLSALPKNVDIDIYSYANDGINAVVNKQIIRQGRMQGGDSFNILALTMSEDETIMQFIMQSYENENLPDEIITSLSDENVEILSNALKAQFSKKCHIFSPKIGVRKALYNISYQNACDALNKSIDKAKVKQDMTFGACDILKETLGLKKLRRIECYDISNISGVDKVASLTVAINGETEPKLYRRFKIKTVEGANDFASMKEVLVRRLLRLKNEDSDISFGDRPDLIVVDGGLGQIKYAKMAMEEVGVEIPLVSLAKQEEIVYFSEDLPPLRLKKSNNGIKLIIRLRDEAHRFAITYFRTLHKNNALISQLDKIEGIGKQKKQALIDKFKKISNIKKASLKELMQVEGIGDNLAKTIFAYFNKG